MVAATAAGGRAEVGAMVPCAAEGVEASARLSQGHGQGSVVAHESGEGASGAWAGGDLQAAEVAVVQITSRGMTGYCGRKLVLLQRH